MNLHPRDALIEFDAGPHKYTCAGESNYLSVTTWLHTHFPPFDADAIIKKMNLTNPKNKYYGQTPEHIKAGWDQVRDEAATAGTAMHAAIEEYWVGVGGHPPGPPLSGGAEADRGSVREYPVQAGAEASGGSVREYPVPAGAEASGGSVREYPVPAGAEASLSSFAVHPLSASAHSAACPRGGVWGVSPHFAQFITDHPFLRCYRAEWMIFDEDVRLAGSIDFVSENADGTLTLYDWKRCKEIKKTNPFGGFAETECIAHLPDTNYWHYALQLNTYKTILERKYEKKIKEMFLVGLHPALPSYQLLKVPHLRQELAALFALRSN
jgi:hypothetical protein